MFLAKIRCFFKAILGLLLFASSLEAGTGFNLADLPEGKQVTLPGSVEITGAMAQELQISSTDMPQSFRLMIHPSPNTGSKSPKAVRLAIYEKNQERPRYVDLRANAPMMYSFRRLGPVRVTPMDAALKSDQLSKISIVSNKPLSISRRSTDLKR